MKALLLHNPTAGTGDHDHADLIQAVQRAGYAPEPCSTKDDCFPQILAGDHDLIVVAGGDGTVGKVLTKLERRDAPVVIVPLGTANNVARSLGLTIGIPAIPTPDTLADHLVKLDMGVASYGEDTEVLSEGIGMGALAATMDERVGKGEKGWDKVLEAREVVARVIAMAAPFKATLRIDGRVIEGDFLFAEALLHAFVGPALQLSPIADSSDGEIDLVLLEPDRRDEMAAWVRSPANSDPPVRIERGRRVEMEWSTRPALRADDAKLDLPSSVKRLCLRVQKDPVRVVVPAPGTSGKRTTTPAAEVA